ncbi:MAG: cysteine desulfurase NifS [Candidatus Brocadiaceae bacterium]|nr:cysteine desulfurase NifS [Candidatus Brocadiaceae bacterium]
MKSIYMDHSATTPVRPEVIEAMSPYFGDLFGNPSSVHTAGRRAHEALEAARGAVAAAIGAAPGEIIFTGSGTESDNLAIQGVAAATGKRHVITSAIEHQAVLNTCLALERRGFEVTRLPVDAFGRVSVRSLAEALRDDTCLVTIMLANNEVGTIQAIRELAARAAEAGVPFHTDAVQAVGKIPVDVDELGVHLLSLSAHKFYGPKGVGALYVRPGTRLHAVQHGGHHERGLRAGTENVAGIVGMARALDLAVAEMPVEAPRLRGLRDRLASILTKRVPECRLNGHPEHCLPHIANLSFENVEGESLLMSLDAFGIAVSTGSACTSGTLEPSHVLTSMGIPPEKSHGSLRFSLGRANTVEDVDYVIEKLPAIVERFRQMSPFAGRT